MNDLERERDFYRQQCNELGVRLLKAQQEQTQARQEARSSRTTAMLIHEIYRLVHAKVSLAELHQRFVQIIGDTLNVDRVALLKYQPESGCFIAEQLLGFPKGELLRFTPPQLPDEFYFVNSSCPVGPLSDCLRQAVGTPYLAWTFDLQSDLALLVGNLIEDQHLHRPFEIGFKEILEGSLAVFVEISVRQQTEVALSSSEERFRQVVSSIADHLYMTELTATGTPVNLYLSPNVTDLTGYPLERFKSDWSFWPSLIHPDDRAVAVAQVEEFRQGRSSEVEYRLARADGQVIWVRDSGRVEKSPDGQGLVIYGVVSHITERRQTEEALRESEAANRAILEAIPDLLVRLHRDGTYLDVKAGEEFATLLPPEEMIGKNIVEVLPPAVAKQLMAGVAQALQTGGTQILEYQVDMGDHFVFREARLVPSAADEALILMRDITERRRIEESLRQSEVRSRALLDAIPDLIIRFSRGGVYLDVKEARDMPSIIPLEEIIGQNMADMLPPEVVERQMRHIEQALDTGDIQVYEQKFMSAGQEKYEEVRVVPSGAQEVLMLFRDVTERKQVEAALAYEQQLLQALLDNTPDYLFFKDRQSRFIRTNRAHAQELLNLDRAEEAIGLTDFDLFPAADAQRFYDEEQRIMATQVPVLARELSIPNPTRGGETAWVSEHKIPLLNQTGQVYGLLGIARDITERKRIEDTLAKRATELEIVAQVGTATATILDTDRLLQEVVDLTRERFNLYHAHIYLLKDPSPTPSFEGGGEGGVLELAAGAGEVGRHMVAEGWHIPLEREQSLVARAARTRQGVIVNDVQAEPGFLPNPLLPETQSELAVPMIVADHLVGVLDVQADTVDRFTAVDVRIQTTLAAQVTVALENARLLQQIQAALNETEEQAQRLAHLSRMSAQLNLAATEADIFKLAALQTPQIVPADRTSVALLTEAGDSLTILALQGEAGVVPMGASWPCEGTALGQVVRENLMLSTPDIRASDLLDNILIAKQGIISTVNVPLVVGGQVIGTLNVGNMQPNAFSLRDENMLRQIGALLSSAIENRRLLQKTQAALAEVQQSQTLMRTVIDATPDWIFIKDQEHRYRLANRGYANALHIIPEEFIGKNDLELGFPEELVKGNPERGIRGFWADDRLVIDSGETHIYPNDPATIDGELHVFHTIKTPLRDAAGQVWGVLAFARDITDRERVREALAKRAAELSCLNDLGREMESAPLVAELLEWVTGRVPPAMQYPELCRMAIEYGSHVYGLPEAIDLPTQMTHGLYVGGEIMGRLYIAYTDKHDFLNEESALLGGIANRLSGYLENRRLFELAQSRARREELLRQVSDHIRRSVDVETIMRTAAQEVGQALGRPAFVLLGNGDSHKKPSHDEKKDV